MNESEHRTADALEMRNIRWEYEPTEFQLRWDEEGRPIEAFRPDFFLVDFGIYIEVTMARQKLTTRKNSKARRTREMYGVQVHLLYRADFEHLDERLDEILTSARNSCDAQAGYETIPAVS